MSMEARKDARSPRDGDGGPRGDENLGHDYESRMSPSARHKQSLVQQDRILVSAVEICISSKA